MKSHFNSTRRECGTNKNIDFHGDGVKGPAKPYTVRFGKRLARRARRRYSKVVIQYDATI